MLKPFLKLAFLMLLIVSVAACGGEKTDDTSSDDTAQTSKDDSKGDEKPETDKAKEDAGKKEKADANKSGSDNPWATVKSDEVTATIDMKATGETMAEMAYAPQEVEAPAYSYVQLNFENTASTDGMNHNVVIIPNDEDVAAEIRSNTTGGPEFAPKADDRIIARTDMMLPGNSTSIGFETPEPGEYLIICTYPGHQDMTAKLIVK